MKWRVISQAAEIAGMNTLEQAYVLALACSDEHLALDVINKFESKYRGYVRDADGRLVLPDDAAM